MNQSKAVRHGFHVNTSQYKDYTVCDVVLEIGTGGSVLYFKSNFYGIWQLFLRAAARRSKNRAQFV